MKLRISALLGITLLAGSASWSAPKRKPALKPTTRMAPITEVHVSQDDGGLGGFNGGAGMSWTFRSNGTVSRSESQSTSAAMETGDTFIPHTSGRFNKEDFRHLVEYLAQSRVLALQIPASKDQSPGLNIGVMRGGKLKSIRITDAAAAPAQTAGWVTMKLVEAITKDVDWKDPSGLSVNTRIDGQFEFSKDENAPKEAPPVTVLNEAGKNVGYLAESSPSGAFRLVLPPGTYRLQVYTPDDLSKLKGYEWKAPAIVQIEAGRITTIRVRQQKAPVAP